MANGLVSIPVGIDEPYIINLLDDYGNPVTTYTTADTPYATVWSGQNTPVVLTPTCAWISAPAGTFSMTIVGSQTSSLTPGRYRLRYGVNTAGGLTVAAPDVFIEFTDSPGTQATLTTYCTHQDLRNYAPWIDTLQAVTDESGFLVQRAKSRQWLERIIQKHNPLGQWNSVFTGIFGNYIGEDGFFNNQRNWGQTDSVLQGWLDANYLKVTEQTIEITSKYALYLIANAQIGPDDKMTSWQNLAQQFYADCQRLVKAYAAEIYLSNNAVTPVRVIPCGRVTIR